LRASVSKLGCKRVGQKHASARMGHNLDEGVVHIFTWAKSQLEERKDGISSICEHEEIKAIEGVGLEGDRYAKRKGLYSGMNFTCQQVTIFDIAQYDEICNKPRMRTAKLSAMSLRRNIGLRLAPSTTLNSWIGHEVEIGTAVVFVHMHGNPCPALEKTLKAAGFLEAAWDLCGVHAEVVQGGIIRHGDVPVVRPLYQPERITGPATLRRRIHGAYLRPSLRQKLVPDLVCTLTEAADGYISAVHYADATGHLGSWPPDARPLKGPIAKAAITKQKGIVPQSHLGFFLAGVAIATGISMLLQYSRTHGQAALRSCLRFLRPLVEVPVSS